MPAIILIIIIICVVSNKNKLNQNKINNTTGMPTATSRQKNKMTREEMDAAKQRIRERMQNPADPHYMPKQAKQPSKEMIELYHDTLDECKTDDCDITANAQGKVVQEQCDIDGCDVETTPQAPVSLAQDPSFKRLPIVYQLTVADAILRRGGKALNGRR